MQYSGLFTENGVLISFLKTFLRCEDAEDNPYFNVRMMRIGLIANTTLIQQESKRENSSEYLCKRDKSVFYLNVKYMYIYSMKTNVDAYFLIHQLYIL